MTIKQQQINKETNLTRNAVMSIISLVYFSETIYAIFSEYLSLPAAYTEQ